MRLRPEHREALEQLAEELRNQQRALWPSLDSGSALRLIEIDRQLDALEVTLRDLGGLSDEK